MRFLAALVVGVVLLGEGVLGDAFGRLATRYDYVNLDILFNSNRLFKNYVDCMVGKKHCPPEGTDLKRHLPDLLATRCASCTPRQRDILVKIAMRMEEDYPQQMGQLRKRWDPSGRMFENLKAFVEKSYPEEMQNRAVRAAKKEANKSRRVGQRNRSV